MEDREYSLIGFTNCGADNLVLELVLNNLVNIIEQFNSAKYDLVEGQNERSLVDEASDD